MASGSDAGTAAAGNRPVVTRFAPSPTGYLHIGGARTALFNWLFARHHGGKYLLRIEDTDRARSTEQAIAAIFDGLEWLGLAGDEPAVMQFVRSQRHAEVAADLLTAGHAYRCYLTPEELAERRARRRPNAARSASTANGAIANGADPANAPADKPFVVRIKAPREGETAIDDLVQGRVTVSNAELDDFVLLRSDGTPTYMLAVVVDDHDMGVTHVIRGDDHLNNAFRQLVIVRGDELAGAVLCPRSADPRRRRRQAVQAPRRARRRCLSRRAWAFCPKRCSTICCASAGATATTRSSRASRRWHGSTSPMSARARHASIMAKLLNLNGHYMREADDARLAGLVAAANGGRPPISIC